MASLLFLRSTVLATGSAGYASWAAVAAAAAALIAAGIGVATLVSDRFYRRRDALSKLLERFEAAGFYVLVWRGEMIGRRNREPAWSLQPIDVAELERRAASDAADSRRIAQLLAKDRSSDRAGMHEIYFFALQTHAWLTAGWLRRDHMTRLINETFGYQLLSTLLDHRTFACRLRRNDRPERYYAEQWGCLDASYRDLVDRLGRELLNPRRHELSFGLAEPLRKKLEATNRKLNEFAAAAGATS